MGDKAVFLGWFHTGWANGDRAYPSQDDDTDWKDNMRAPRLQH